MMITQPSFYLNVPHFEKNETMVTNTEPRETFTRESVTNCC